jgi:hypothetical protein
MLPLFDSVTRAAPSWQAKCNASSGLAKNLSEGESMRDVDLVLRNKRVQLAELALEIHGLEAAAMSLRSVVHLLAEE